MVCKGFGPDFFLLKYNDMQLSCIFEKKKKKTKRGMTRLASPKYRPRLRTGRHTQGRERPLASRNYGGVPDGS
jgi:hypothetical protein